MRMPLSHYTILCGANKHHSPGKFCSAFLVSIPVGISPSFTGLVPEWVSPSDPHHTKGIEHGKPRTPAGHVCRALRGRVGTALPHCVCTINTMFNVQTELECWQHAAANTIVVTQELDGSLLRGNRFVFLPSIHLMNKQLHGMFTTLLLNSLAET